MRILFFILIFFIFSCEDELGVQEYQESFNYYDFIAYGWAEYKSQNYQKAIDWFEQSLTINDVDQDGVEDNAHNSAYVGISWAKTQLVNSELSNNFDEIDSERIEAIKYLLLNENAGIWNEISDISNDICIPPTIWEDGSCLFDMSEIDISDNKAKQTYDIADNDSGTIFCLQDYCCSDCFIKDKKVALLYYYLKKFNDSIEDDEISKATDFFEEMKQLGNDLVCFSGTIDDQDCVIYQNDDVYNFMKGKPVLDPPLDINLDYIDLILSLGNLYIEMAENSDLAEDQNNYYCKAAAILKQTEQCQEATCDTVEGFEKLTTCIQNFDN